MTASQRCKRRCIFSGSQCPLEEGHAGHCFTSRAVDRWIASKSDDELRTLGIVRHLAEQGTLPNDAEPLAKEQP